VEGVQEIGLEFGHDLSLSVGCLEKNECLLDICAAFSTVWRKVHLFASGMFAWELSAGWRR